MSVNLYTADLGPIGGTELYQAIEALLRMSEPLTERPSEGWTLDFKEQWSDEMVRHTAAFANTFGGLLIVGVSEKSGKPNEIVGVPLRSELKTQIASTISASVSPTPTFAIAECVHPSDQTRRIAVVRVRNVSKLHYYMKGDKPVYVRNEDESRPATAIQLRSLIEQRTRESTPVDASRMLKELSSRFYVTKARQTGTYEERKANRTRSSTSLTVLIRPAESLTFPFDSSTEDLFDAVVARSFPEVARRWNDQRAERLDKRGSDWHEIEFWQNNLDFEMSWIFSPREVALVSQINVPITGFGNSWSLADVALNIAFLLCEARDNRVLEIVRKGEEMEFEKWANLFLENYSKPPIRAAKTHTVNLRATKHLKAAFQGSKLADLTADQIELYLRKRLRDRVRIRTTAGYIERGELKPATVHQELRVLRRMLNVAVRKKLLPSNPCAGVEFPVAVKGLFRPHYVTWSEQRKIEIQAPEYLRNIVRIITETGLRVYKELMPMKKEHLDLANAVVWIPDSKTPNGIAEVPLTPIAVEAFRDQLRLSPCSPYLFPSDENPSGHQRTLKTVWSATLRRAQIPHFRIYDLRSTYATRLSAGGVADEWVTQLLRQGDAKVFKKYSQMKLQMKREALVKLNRMANEQNSIKNLGYDTARVN